MATPSSISAAAIYDRSYYLPSSLSPADSQIAILQQAVNSRFNTPEQLQQLYFQTIRICAVGGREAETSRLLSESEASNIFEGQPELRARLYLSVVLILVEKGFHDKAHQLYKEALEKGIWNAYSSLGFTARQKLEEVGFIFHGTPDEVQINYTGQPRVFG